MTGSKTTSEFDQSPFGVAVYDSVSDRFMDFMLVVLMESAEHTLIPQLYDIFGRENFLKFMDIFAGTTLKVPSVRPIEDSMRKVGIYLRLREVPDGAKAEAIADLAQHYGVSKGEVRKSFIAMEARFKRYKLASEQPA